MKIEKHYEYQSKFDVGDSIVMGLDRRYVPQDVKSNEKFASPSYRTHAKIIEIVFDEREREFMYLCELINRERIWLVESAVYCS